MNNAHELAIWCEVTSSQFGGQSLVKVAQMLRQQEEELTNQMLRRKNLESQIEKLKQELALVKASSVSYETWWIKYRDMAVDLDKELRELLKKVNEK
jgi:uncharacterized protein YhaN